jgi:tetratricopeptide (TPR) repeat protein
MAVNTVGDALSGGGGTFTSDEDPELIREALPFGLKTYESLLAMSPNHEGLLLSSATGFSAYALMLTREADEIEAKDYRRARELRARASKLFLRGRNFATRGIETRHTDFTKHLFEDRNAALAALDAKDADFLYWAGASWGGAVSASLNDPQLIGSLPFAASLVERLLEVDEDFDKGAAHDLYFTIETSRPGGDPNAAMSHYERALELSEGNRASTYLALAESVAVNDQDLKLFNELIDKALAIDPDAVPEWRLVNIMSQYRARWLKTQIPDLFLDDSEEF